MTEGGGGGLQARLSTSSAINDHGRVEVRNIVIHQHLKCYKKYKRKPTDALVHP